MEKNIRGKTLCVNIDWTTTTWTMLILSVSVIPVYIMQMFLFAVLLNKSGLDLTCCGIFNWSSVLYRFDCAYLHTKRNRDELTVLDAAESVSTRKSEGRNLNFRVGTRSLAHLEHEFSPQSLP